jgi:hypothetical protein
MCHSLRRIIASLLLGWPLWGWSQPMEYIYPPPESGADVRLNYYWELLESALVETSPKWGDYVVRPSTKPMNAARAEMMLTASNDISIMARTTSIQREQTLRPIRIPLDKGLTGYRMFLIKSDTQSRTDNVRTQEQLQTLSIGQGATWVDTEILRSAGFTVVTSPTYDNLLPMLDANRFDLFSRGVNEISREFEIGKTQYPKLAVETKILLYYPLPRYYFFSNTPQGERLAQRVEEGLQLLMKNGKFERHYQAYKKSILAGITLTGRRLFRLPNSQLPAATPLADRDLWDTLDTELKARP